MTIEITRPEVEALIIAGVVITAFAIVASYLGLGLLLLAEMQDPERLVPKPTPGMIAPIREPYHVLKERRQFAAIGPLVVAAIGACAGPLLLFYAWRRDRTLALTLTEQGSRGS